MSPSQPEPHNLENAVGNLLGFGHAEAEFASLWFLSNPNLEREEQEANLLQELEAASDPVDAAKVAVETAYDLMEAESANRLA